MDFSYDDMVKAEQGLDSPALGDSFGPAGFQSTTSSMSSLPTIHLDSKNSTKEDLLPMPMFHTSMQTLQHSALLVHTKA